MGDLINGFTPEEIKESLKICAEGGDYDDCERRCPFHRSCAEGKAAAAEYIERLEGKRDAELAKPLQRPMTLEETWEKSKEVSDNVVWLEFKEEHEDYLYVIPALISNTAPWPFGMNHLPTIRYFRFLVWPKDIIEVEKEKYGEKHRCWASKPTDEERAAAKWEV